MECNKEEAVRAKKIAEKKMQSKDFVGARKIALKAQQLYPDLENISQMLVVCDVHCSAERKLFGDEMDWYAILQIEQTSNEATIKKQYRKFALQLHPDKNNFAGAEAAFKLIGEAQRVLLDREKRAMHDRRRAFVVKPTVPYQPPQGPRWNSNIMSQNNFRSNMSGLNPQNWQSQEAAQAVPSNIRSTFWTQCPFCLIRYQFYKDVINRSIRCQTCEKPFTAYDMNVQGAAPTAFSQPVFPQQKNNGSRKVEMHWQQNFSRVNPRAESVHSSGKKVDLNSYATSVKVNRKRERKQVVESSESSDSDSESSAETEEAMEIDENGDIKGVQNFGYFGEQNPRRSSRRKQQVSYKENLSDDDDFVSPSKKPNGTGSSHATEEGNGDTSKKEESNINNSNSVAGFKKDQKVKQKKIVEECSLNGGRTTQKSTRCKVPMEDDGSDKIFEVHDNKNSVSDDDPRLQSFDLPYPDFSDFEKDRKVECFAVGQTWALYDVQNAMPRFYARIKKVLNPGFKVVITWLEPDPDPDDKDQIKWIKRDLPVSCGKFRYGNSDTITNRLMFSHMVSLVKGGHRNRCKINPMKGETWALFKNWDIKWNSDHVLHDKRKYEYEFVEILSEFVEGVGVNVALLEKVKGFECLFCRAVKEGKEKFLVTASELLRFSHRVPSYKMIVDEVEGVPPDSFELDPASLPTYFRSARNNKAKTGCDKNTSVYQNDVKRSHSQPQDSNSGSDIEDSSDPSSPSTRDIEIPEPEFYNFDDDKSQEKFQMGQIWALYSDEDGLPKYYGQITKIDSCPVFRVHIAWLASSSLPDHVIRWSDQDMPICCGLFRVKRGSTQAYDQINSFSHQVKAYSIGKKNEHAIYPRKGEVWALYRDWSADLKSYELQNCEYDIVEVLEENNKGVKVMVLERVDGFNSVFKAQVQEGLTISKVIAQMELLKFSHQIPAFRLKNEREGSLRGCWEIDPAALPVNYFSST
ncbi:hypothetical protein FEM48_Zijuj12G0178800 [Ziziphus jujuba var. spinosa]|uniref:J domain-containing protein n=1 Tax=Ziziphus jujuba var. spinosa TaxID=714518 RepID=A0A978UES1_ZIZJJ|nr:hypothetical protein FEM48_Zijuj12G0178800 [Ziziphus jujuba var. spinosa]